jgi:hypothetical protein
MQTSLDAPMRWQVKIWIREKLDRSVTIYGETLAKLREVTEEWLRENKPLLFRGGDVTYSYSDGTKVPPYGRPGRREGEPLEEGWWWIIGGGWPEGPKDFDSVIHHFIAQGMIIQKGPDYQDVALVEGDFPLHLIKTIKRESNEREVNDLLYRGWYIIALEYEGKTDYFGERLTDRKAMFVLGHPEENAV